MYYVLITEIYTRVYMWYWYGITRALSDKGYHIFRVKFPDRETQTIDLAQAKLMKPYDFGDNFIMQLSSIDNLCFIFKR